MAISVKLIVLVASYAVLYNDAVEVSTRNGVIIGSDHLRTRDGNVIYSFTGIPYAQPPVGKLRFKEAQPVKPWETPLNATGSCPKCAQFKVFGPKKGVLEIVGQEDCLRLNVHSSSLDAGKKLPVMLFLHGGAYTFSAAVAEPEFLVNDLVLVHMSYRLSALGFATTGDGVIPANLGLKDQVMALKWVHENIEHFGGDPNSVTVLGESAGGASTHLLLLSPLTKGLIHRGISMSGTATCPWAMIPRQLAVDRTKALAVLNGCPPIPSEELLECLQNIPVRRIVGAQKKFGQEYSIPLTIFAPVIEEPTAENAILTSDPERYESEIPWMTGITSAEHLGYPPKFLARVEANGLKLEEEFELFLFDWLQHGFHIEKKNITAVADKIVDFYFGGRLITKEKLVKLDDMMTDGWFLKGIVDDVPKYKGNTYVYYYDYLQSNATHFSIFGPGLEKGKGVSHQDDLLSIFPMSHDFPNRTLSELDVQVSKKMVSLLTTFAKFGHFKMNNVTTWEPVEQGSSKMKHLYVGAAEFAQKEDLLTDKATFWRTL